MLSFFVQKSGDFMLKPFRGKILRQGNHVHTGVLTIVATRLVSLYLDIRNRIAAAGELIVLEWGWLGEGPILLFE